MSQPLTLSLVSSRLLNPSCRHLRFALDAPFRFVPGQFIQIHFEHSGRALKRSYSIGNADAERGELEIAVSYVDGGPATALLSTIEVGANLSASGPYGRFVLNDADQNQRYLLLATGTGVTPYRAMLNQIAERIATRGQRFVLLFGARSEAELLYGEEFAAFAAAQPAFKFYPCFSRAPREPAQPFDRRGHVQHALAELKPDPVHDIAYLCGNPNMVDQGFEALKVAGLPIPHIRREKYVSPK
jgi:ferredoxin-NADP reductase